MMIVVAGLLVLDAAYFVNGSLEMFPTEEQQSKVRVVTAWLGAVLILLEAGLIVLFLWLRRVAARQRFGVR